MIEFKYMENSKKELIHFVITGGTIDSYYAASQDTVMPNDQTAVPQFIKSTQLMAEVEYTVVCMKDSRQIDDGDRQAVLRTIEESAAKKIIVTHGTYTMPDTARFLKAKLKANDKVVILTGSMIPLVGFSPSDAPFNLGYAIARLGDLQPGVYVAMHGHIFEPEEIVKQLNEGKFISIFGEQ